MKRIGTIESKYESFQYKIVKGLSAKWLVHFVSDNAVEGVHIRYTYYGKFTGEHITRVSAIGLIGGSIHQLPVNPDTEKEIIEFGESLLRRWFWYRLIFCVIDGFMSTVSLKYYMKKMQDEEFDKHEEQNYCEI